MRSLVFCIFLSGNKQFITTATDLYVQCLFNFTKILILFAVKAWDKAIVLKNYSAMFRFATYLKTPLFQILILSQILGFQAIFTEIFHFYFRWICVAVCRVTLLYNMVFTFRLL